MSETPSPAPRTLRIDDTVIVLDSVRAARLEPSYAHAHEEQWFTQVFFHGLIHPVPVRGDHMTAIAAAIEARSLPWG